MAGGQLLPQPPHRAKLLLSTARKNCALNSQLYQYHQPYPNSGFCCCSSLLTPALTGISYPSAISGARICLGTWKWLRQWTTPSSAHAACERAHELHQISSVAWRQVMMRLPYLLSVVRSLYGPREAARRWARKDMATNLHLLSHFQNPSLSADDAFPIQVNAKVCFSSVWCKIWGL